MKLTVLLVITLSGIWITSAVKVKKCLSSLPKSIPSGAEVDTATDKVKFPAATRDPTAQSKIKTEYDSKGLDAFFNLAKSFMNSVQKKELPDMKDSTGKFDFSKELKELQKQSGKLYDYEVPIIACAGIGIVLALLMPLIGCCFCCCRCCGKCGGDMTQDDKEANSHCKCCVFAIILVVVTIFMVAGVGMMYVTNNSLKSDVEGTPETYDNALSEAWRYLENTRKELKEITVNKTNCLYEDLLVPDISDDGLKNLVGIPLKNTLQPHILSALDAVSRASENVTAMKNALDVVANTSAELKSSAAQLGNELKKIKADLEQIKSDCNSSGIPGGCSEIKTDGLKQDANFTNLPNVDDELNNVRDIVNQNFSGSVDKARKVFDDIPQTVVNEAGATLKDVRKLAKDGKEKIVNTTKDIYKKLDDIINDKSNFEKYKNNQINDAVKFDKFRFYGFIGLAGIMTLIVVLLAIGLCCGIISYDRDKTPTNRSAASHHGGNMIMASIGFMFIFSFFFFLFTAIFFLIGIHLHVLCRELKDGGIIDKYAGDQIKYNGTKIVASDIIRNCRKGQAIYVAINGKSVFNLNDKLNFSKLVNIDETLDKLNVNLADQSVLNADTEKSLNDLKNSSVDKINFTSFFTEIRKSIVAVNLTVLAANLTELANNMSALPHPSANKTATDLRYVAGNLTQMESTTIKQIEGWTNLLEKNLEDLKAKAGDLEVVAQNVLDELKKADNYMKNNANADVKNLVKTFVNRVLGWPNQFVQHVLSELDKNIATCKPLANIYDGIINTYYCTGIVGNFNGFWFAMGWCLFFFPFASIFGVKLAKFLRRMNCKAEFDPYPGYEMQQHPVKLPLNELPRLAQTTHGTENPSYSGHGSNAAPPPYEG